MASKFIFAATGTRTFMTAIAGALPEPVTPAKANGKIKLANFAAMGR
jgi:hypothetical protein